MNAYKNIKSLYHRHRAARWMRKWGAKKAFVGDMLWDCGKYPKTWFPWGKEQANITDFYIYDGKEWVHAQEANKRIYVVGPKIT